LNNQRFESNACLILKPGGGGGVVYKLQWGVAVTIAGSIDDQSKSKKYKFVLSKISITHIVWQHSLCEDDWRNWCCNVNGLLWGNLLVLPAHQIIQNYYSELLSCTLNYLMHMVYKTKSNNKIK